MAATRLLATEEEHRSLAVQQLIKTRCVRTLAFLDNASENTREERESHQGQVFVTNSLSENVF